MARVLIVCSSKYGQTEKIANYIGEQLNLLGHTYDVYVIGKDAAIVSVESYDGIVVGAPIYSGRMPGKLINWLQKHKSLLSVKPTALYVVCLAIQQKDPSVQKNLQKITATFLQKVQWQPGQFAFFAGALTYSKYGFILKRIMRSISRKAGGRDFFKPGLQIYGLERGPQFHDEVCI